MRLDKKQQLKCLNVVVSLFIPIYNNRVIWDNSLKCGLQQKGFIFTLIENSIVKTLFQFKLPMKYTKMLTQTFRKIQMQELGLGFLQETYESNLERNKKIPVNFNIKSSKFSKICFVISDYIFTVSKEKKMYFCSA